MTDINSFIGPKTLTISQVMERIGSNSYGILFITDDNDRLSGCITDGDIRRHLLSGGSLEDNVMKAATRKPKVARYLGEAMRLYEKQDYVVIPIVNDDNRIIELYYGEMQIVRRPAKLDVPVVINAGGRGTRLDPFTRVLPKPLIPIGEIPIIELIMRQFQDYDCDDFHIIVNYKKELMKAYFADVEKDYKISWYNERKPLGTAGGLSLLKGEFKDTFFFSNCDVLITSDFEKILKFHKENNNKITMVCANKKMVIPYGVVETGKDGIIERIKEKPTIPFATNTGLYILEPEIADDIEDGKSIDFTDVVEMEIKKGRKVAAYPIDEEEWMDMGQFSELEKMREKLYGRT